jgi:26S proteasome regulatory subunit N7
LECLLLLSTSKYYFKFSELSSFIAQGRISAKIDKVTGIIECVQDEPTVDLYQRTLKDSDVLLTKIHKLSKLLEL